MPQKYKLPAGWEVRSRRNRLNPLLRGRCTKYIYAAEHLVVRKVEGTWRLFHLGIDTGHKFDTAQAAIAYAEDARFAA